MQTVQGKAEELIKNGDYQKAAEVALEELKSWNKRMLWLQTFFNERVKTIQQLQGQTADPSTLQSSNNTKGI